LPEGKAILVAVGSADSGHPIYSAKILTEIIRQDDAMPSFEIGNCGGRISEWDFQIHGPPMRQQFLD
jgi:hypothetical protein